jgi:methyl-accepting chemotaxis protein
MRIDYLLSRFRIQTKVSIFVVPFILCICAVGIIGLVTSHILSNRLVLSNETIRSLGGFRDLSAAMNQFLEHSSEAARDDVLSQTKVLMAFEPKTPQTRIASITDLRPADMFRRVG